MARKVRMLGPGELQRDAVRHGSQALIAVEVLQPTRQAHVVELAHRTRRQTVPAGLLAREALLVHHEHGMAVLREPVGRRRARRTRPHDQRIPTRTFHAGHGRATLPRLALRAGRRPSPGGTLRSSHGDRSMRAPLRSRPRHGSARPGADPDMRSGSGGESGHEVRTLGATQKVVPDVSLRHLAW
jgi:hypothetical protein